MSTILTEIARSKKIWVRTCKQRCSEQTLLRQATEHTAKGFASALSQRIDAQENAVVAEVKKASPSKGVIREDFDPVWIAQRYAASGASCLSVLTDVEYFQGSDDYLRSIRQAVNIPLLRKDFMLDPYQVVEAAAMGADAILLILAMLDDTQLEELAAAAVEFNLDILPEVHNRYELDRTLECLQQTSLLGINNRNLHTFETNLETTMELLPHCPSHCTVITESGIHQHADVERMNRAGIYGFLVGESLMRQQDPGEALKKMLGDDDE